MTQEDKDILLKDLCARLPYGVKVCARFNTGNRYTANVTAISADRDYIQVRINELHPYTGSSAEDIRPYLRPMSSMTEEEAFEMFHTVFHQVSLIGVDIESDRFRFKMVDDGQFAGYTVLFFDKIYSLEQSDWLLSHHFDYRGLILMGLALEAPDNMYKTE